MAEGPAPLKGILHCAGVVDDGILLKLDPTRTQFVLGPKLAAWTLHQLSESLPLDFTLFFSSTASIWGTAGQSTYCAANAYLDQLAQWRCAQGHRTVAVQWGGWDEIGMSADLGDPSYSHAGPLPSLAPVLLACS